MTNYHVFVIGETLFAEILIRMLAESGQLEIAGTARTPSEALPSLGKEPLDAVIVVGVEKPSLAAFDPLLEACPNTPILSTNLNDDSVQVYTRQRLNARFSTLLEAITQLPLRR